MQRDGWTHLRADRSKMLMEQHILRARGRSIASILCLEACRRVVIMTLRDERVEQWTVDPESATIEQRKNFVERRMRREGWL